VYYKSNESVEKQQVKKRNLPAKVIIGYASNCDDKVEKAIRQGANVVIWSFMDLKPADISDVDIKLDFACIRNLISAMDSEGYDDTVHMISFGGWNGSHFDPFFQTAEDWYFVWKSEVGKIFHGIDFDFEGNDNLNSPLNFFSKEMLEMMGKISKLAKQDGYIISIVPPQSYLDFQSSKFSQYVNLTDTERDWHSDFQYFGSNIYAYILAKYGEYIDLILVQFYESFSRAAMEIHHRETPPEWYLSDYVQDLFNKKQQFLVDFENVPELGLKNQNVSLPLSKLVWGFGNGWIDRTDDKHVYFPPECIQAAYQDLVDWMMEPRGMMFWCISNEGKDGIYYAKELNNIIHTRPSQASVIE
jgi:beta-glucosidase